MKIRTRILLLLSVGVVVPMLISHLFSYRVHSREFRRSAESALLTQARQSAGRVNDRLAWMLETSSMLIRSVPFENFTPEELPEALSIPYRQLSFSNVAVLLDASGRAVVPPYRPAPGSPELLTGRAAVNDTELQRFSRHVPMQLALSAPIAVGPVYFSDNEEPRIVVASSFELMSAERWVLAIGVQLDELCAMVADTARGTRVQLHLVDAKGQLICASSPDADAAADRIALPATDRVVTIDRNGEEVMAVASDVPLTGWRMVIETPGHVFFSRFESIRGGLILWIAVSLLLALSGGIVLSKGITAPIADLLDASRRVSNGHYDERIAIRSRDEIGELSSSFNRMTEEIQRWNRELQARVDRNTRDLREAQEQIIHTQKLAAVGELGAGVAHEINNPLTGVLGNAQLLLSMAEKDSPLRPALEDIAVNARRVATVVDGLLRFSQKQWDESMEPVVPANIWKSVLALHENRIREAGVAVVWTRVDDAPITGARGNLQIAFSHLLDNALQSMNEGGKITLESACVEGGAVMVSIADTGCGMTEEIRQRSMEPFFTTRAPGSGAAGMGLAMVYRVAVAHDARVAIQSTPGVGTHVTLYFPGILKMSRQ